MEAENTTIGQFYDTAEVHLVQIEKEESLPDAYFDFKKESVQRTEELKAANYHSRMELGVLKDRVLNIEIQEKIFDKKHQMKERAITQLQDRCDALNDDGVEINTRLEMLNSRMESIDFDLVILNTKLNRLEQKINATLIIATMAIFIGFYSIYMFNAMS